MFAQLAVIKNLAQINVEGIATAELAGDIHNLFNQLQQIRDTIHIEYEVARVHTVDADEVENLFSRSEIFELSTGLLRNLHILYAALEKDVSNAHLMSAVDKVISLLEEIMSIRVINDSELLEIADMLFNDKEERKIIKLPTELSTASSESVNPRLTKAPRMIQFPGISAEA